MLGKIVAWVVPIKKATSWERLLLHMQMKLIIAALQDHASWTICSIVYPWFEYTSYMGKHYFRITRQIIKGFQSKK